MDTRAIKEKNIKIKGANEQEFLVNLKLYEKSITIEALVVKDVTQSKYSINFSYEDFSNLDSFFNQFKNIEEIFELLEDMKENEFKIIKESQKIIEFYLLIEVRKRIKEIPIKLVGLEIDMNDTVRNLSETVRDLKDKEIPDLQKQNEILKKQILTISNKFEEMETKMKENFEKHEKIIEYYMQQINEDKKIINEIQNQMNQGEIKIEELQDK